MPTDRSNILTTERVPDGGRTETALAEAGAVAAAPLAASPPAPSLSDRCLRQADALEGVEVETADRIRFSASVRLALRSRGSGGTSPGAMLSLTGPAQSGSSRILQQAYGLLPAPPPTPKDPWTSSCPVLGLRLKVCDEFGER